jgi:hypothetical protein
MGPLDRFFLPQAREGVRLALDRAERAMIEATITENRWKARVEYAQRTAAETIEESVANYFDAAAQATIFADIDLALRRLADGLERCPTHTAIVHSFKFLRWLKTANTGSPKDFYTDPYSRLKTRELSIRTAWGTFSSAETLYSHLLCAAPPEYSET